MEAKVTAIGMDKTGARLKLTLKVQVGEHQGREVFLIPHKSQNVFVKGQVFTVGFIPFSSSQVLLADKQKLKQLWLYIFVSNAFAFLSLFLYLKFKRIKRELSRRE